MRDLNTLASRVEDASGDQTRELLIEAAEASLLATGHDPDTEEAMGWLDRFEQLIEAEAYLDAALTLVPEGYVWGVGPWGNPDTDGPWAWCATKQQSADNDLDYTKAATPALALCAASLRARSAMEKK